MLKILQRSSFKLGRLLFLIGLVLSIAAAAVLVTLRYWVLPDIEKYHDEVTRSASRALGVQVKIGKIEADLRRLRPHLVFTNIQLLDAQGHSALELRRVENVVSWMSLLRGELRLKNLQVDDPDLLLRRDKQGVLYVAGLPVSGGSSDGKLSDWLLHQARIIVNNGRVTWQDEMYDRPTLVLNQAQLRLDNSGKHHRFAVRVAPPATVAAPLDVRGDLVGDSFSDWSNWHGDLYAQIDHADVGAWGAWISLPDEFNHAKGGVRAWLGVEEGRVSRITADLDMREVWSRLGADLPLLNLARLRGRIGLHKLERGIEVSTTKLSLQMSNGFMLQPTDFHLRLAGAKDSPFAAGEIQASAIELADISLMAAYIPLGKEFKQKLMDFSPRGHIEDLSAQWRDAGRFEVNASFDNLAMRRVGKLPGVEGLSGHVQGSENNGAISLNAPHVKLDAPQFFIEPVTFDTFAVQSGWQRKRDGWDIKLNNFSVANEDLAATAYGNYQTDANSLGVADMSMNVTRASARHLVKYLPKELLGNSTMTWLQAGLLGGEMSEINLRLRGDLDDFPFVQNKKGLFKVDAKVKGAVIDYEKDWPRVENALVTLLIEGHQLQLDSTSAMLAGAKAQKINVTIPNFMDPAPVVLVRGEASGETKHVLSFIKKSPIRGYTNGFSDNTIVAGEGKLDVQIELPLGDLPVKVNANYHFVENEINLDEYIPLARKVTGDLKYADSGVQAKAISAQIFGGPATLDIQTDAKGALKVNMQGKIIAETWRKLEPSPWVQTLSGAADWKTEVSVQGKQFTVLTTSNLQGLACDLPVPLAKHAHEAIPFKYEFKSTNASQDMMTMQYGDWVSGRLLRADNKLGVRSITSGSVDFGAARRGGDREGIWITGTLPVLSVEGWSDVWPKGNGKGPTIDGLDMVVQKVIGYGGIINGLNVHVRNHGGQIAAQLASKDLNGDVNWYPQGGGKIVARFKNAVWAEEEKDKNQAASAPLSDSFSTPAIDVAVEHFTYLGKQLGRLEFYARQVEKDILLDHLRLANPDGVLSLNGKWALSPSQTHIAAKLELYDTGKMLNRSGYPNTLKDGNGALDCDLVWQGAPYELKLANLDGNLNLKMSKGQFLKVDPGAGKLLSVLNLQSLPKRITLDFADVFSKGFEFDDIAGVAQIRQGVIMSNEFKIGGSAAQVALSGQVDLTRETQSLRVRVLPSLGNSVSLLAFVAGPVVGAGVFLANKLFRNPLDMLVSFEYNVTGSWIDPKVEKIGEVRVPPNNTK
jgi:uncharacterized protein (TIGR02099 family)